MIITAKGEKQGNLITVTVNVANHEIEVDGDKKHMYQLLLQEALEESHPIGGTFWPDKKAHCIITVCSTIISLMS